MLCWTVAEVTRANGGISPAYELAVRTMCFKWLNDTSLFPHQSLLQHSEPWTFIHTIFCCSWRIVELTSSRWYLEMRGISHKCSILRRCLRAVHYSQYLVGSTEHGRRAWSWSPASIDMNMHHVWVILQLYSTGWEDCCYWWWNGWENNWRFFKRWISWSYWRWLFVGVVFHPLPTFLFNQVMQMIQYLAKRQRLLMILSYRCIIHAHD